MPESVSFIIPAYNERHYIQGCVEAIQRETSACGLSPEIIVVDNGSVDDTSTLAHAAGAKVYSIDRASVSAARNFGASQTDCPIIAFIDADVLVTRRWAATLAQQKDAILHDGNTLTGAVYAIRNNPSWIERHWFGKLHDRFIPGGNILISRGLFERIGGFNAALRTGEDFDLCERAIAAGANYHENPGFEAIHLGFPQTLKQFIRREIWHGEGDFQTLRRFLASPVAMIALLYLFLQLLAIIAAFKCHLTIAGIALTSLLLLNTALTCWRFRDCSISTLLYNGALNYFYFMARSLSLFAVWRNKL